MRLGDGLPTQLSPDHKWVLTIQRTQPPQLVLLPTGPGEPKPVPRHGFTDFLAAHWFPDGKTIVVNGAEPGHGLRSYVQDLQTGASRPVTPEGVWVQAVSPDGRLLAAAGSGQPVSLYPAAGGEPRRVAGAQPGDRIAGWTSDQQSLFVFRRDELPCRIYKLDVASGRRDLVREMSPADPAGVVATHEVEITPDGRAYAYSFVRILSELFIAEGLK